jgi:rubrerythrin
MEENKALEILKKAILLEQQGMNFYGNIAEHSKSEAVRNIFTIMAEEEKKHMDALSHQYKRYQNEGTFSMDSSLGTPNEFSDDVLNEKIKSEINAAAYEAASISAAIHMEQKAIELYSSRAQEAEESDEKKLYQELADWEKTHVTFLNNIYNDLLEDAWYDSNFWPF